MDCVFLSTITYTTVEYVGITLSLGILLQYAINVAPNQTIVRLSLNEVCLSYY